MSFKNGMRRVDPGEILRDELENLMLANAFAVIQVGLKLAT